MNIRNLNGSELIAVLDKRVKLGAENEAEVIDLIREVMRRGIWIEYGATSMHDFLTRAHYHFAPSDAQRKLDSARLMRDFQEVKEYLISEEINPTQLSMMAAAFRQNNASMKKQKLILEAARGQTIANTQAILNDELEIKVKTLPKVRVQRDGSVRAGWTFTKEEWAELQHNREVVSHAVPSGEMTAVIMYSIRFTTSKKDPAVQRRAKTEERKPRNEYLEAQIEQDRVYSIMDVEERQDPGVTAAARRFVFQRDRGCRHQHEDGSYCDSRYQLQVDHILSRWLGGGNNVENLQLLCGIHNRYKYQREMLAIAMEDGDRPPH